MSAFTYESVLPPFARFLLPTLLALGLIVAVNVVYAAAGNLDPTFGTNGKVESRFDTHVIPEGAVLQPDGKIVAIASVYDSNGIATIAYGVLRYLPDGVLDASFGTNGEAKAAFTNFINTPNSVALQSDGKIVVAGVASSPNGVTSGFTLARFNPNGTLDNSFGSGGFVVTNFVAGKPASASNPATVIMVQPNGQLLVAGSARDCARYGTCPIRTALARYQPNGTLDTSFGVGGIMSVVAIGAPNALALLSNSNILAISGPAIAAFDTHGNLLPAIAPGTIAATGRGNAPDTVDALAGTQYVFAGSATESGRRDTDVHVVRYNVANNTNPVPAGSIDPTFNSPLFDFGPEDINAVNVAQSIAIQSDGKIVLGGGSNFSMVRLNANGGLDGSFGNGGKVTTQFNGVDSVIAVLVQPDGNILAVGSTADPATQLYGPALARYLGR